MNRGKRKQTLDMVGAKVRDSRKNTEGRNDMDKFLFLNSVDSFKFTENIYYM